MLMALLDMDAYFMNRLDYTHHPISRGSREDYGCPDELSVTDVVDTRSRLEGMSLC
jgi:hypothetical protein